jgi:hypothetical protein
MFSIRVQMQLETNVQKGKKLSLDSIRTSRDWRKKTLLNGAAHVRVQIYETSYPRSKTRLTSITFF